MKNKDIIINKMATKLITDVTLTYTKLMHVGSSGYKIVLLFYMFTELFGFAIKIKTGDA